MKKYSVATVLSQSLKRIKKQNSAISIRGLAARIGVSHVFLSKVLSGRASLPQARMKDVVRVFQLDSYAQKELRDAMVADLSASSKIMNIFGRSKPKKKKAVDVYEERPIKHQAVLEHWYELPIMEYLTCENVAKDIESISKNLNLKPYEVLAALNKLEDAQLIAKEASGRWRKTTNFIRFPTVTPSEVLKNYYTQVLKRTTIELSRTAKEDYDRRLLLNFSVAVSSEKIPAVKEKLSQYMYDLTVDMADGPSNEVYHLTVGLIPLTKV
jgi:uncharacterized protein (TIGR02147 family)